MATKFMNCPSGQYLNARQSASTAATILFYIPQGEQVNILATGRVLQSWDMFLRVQYGCRRLIFPIRIPDVSIIHKRQRLATKLFKSDDSADLQKIFSWRLVSPLMEYLAPTLIPKSVTFKALMD